MEIYDLIIIGAGPAGLTAGIYANRYKLSNLIIGQTLGGTLTYAHNVTNFPGFSSISGVKWAQLASEQLKGLGGKLLSATVSAIIKDKDGFKITLNDGREFKAKTLIIATGSQRKELGISGEKEYLGKGVSYCTTCDAPFFKNKTVAVIGGANAAVSGAIHLAGFAQKVYLIYRKENLRAEPAWIEQALNNPKIEVIYKTNLVKILGTNDFERVSKIKNQISKIKNTDQKSKTGITTDIVAGVELDVPYKNSNLLSVDGVFIEIGGLPTSALAASLGIELDETGFIKIDNEGKTKVNGVLAAGDITTTGKILQQAITACAEGAKAAASAFKFLKGQKAPRILGNK
jgi:thioredoxin reductase (NADPH)